MNHRIGLIIIINTICGFLWGGFIAPSLGFSNLQTIIGSVVLGIALTYSLLDITR